MPSVPPHPTSIAPKPIAATAPAGPLPTASQQPGPTGHRGAATHTTQPTAGPPQWAWPAIHNWLNAHQAELAIATFLLTALAVVFKWLNALVGRRWSHFRRKQRSSAIYNYFSTSAQSQELAAEWRKNGVSRHARKAELTGAIGHILPNKLAVLAEGLATTDWQAEPNGRNCIQYFLRAFESPLTAAHQTYLVLGPSGVGKTTFLLNLYQHYASRSAGKAVPDLLLGPLGSGYETFLTHHIQPRISNKSCFNTILLLDALDEHPLVGITNEAQEQELSKFWQDLRTIAPYFRQVVVTVREQFFQTWKIENVKIGEHLAIKLRLCPFGEDARLTYLRLRFGANRKEYDELKHLHSRLTEEGSSLLEIPQLLSFLQEVNAKRNELRAKPGYDEKVFLAPHNLMQVIVDAWLLREAKKGLDPTALRDFCQLLAFKLVSLSSAAGLSAQDLATLENRRLGDYDTVLAAFEGRGDRSLLTRKIIGSRYYFKFIHERFLGYFLALYAEANPDDAVHIPFEKQPYALRYLVGKRWRDLLQLPLPAYQKPEKDDNVVPLTIMRAWGEMLDSLVGDCNEATRAVFRADWEEILAKEVPDWLESFRGVENLTITPANLVRVGDEAAQIGIGYLRNFITEISLRYTQLTNNELAPLLGARQVRWLDLRDTNLPATQLVTFAHSASHLTNLALDNIDLSTESPAWFAHTEHLTQLSLRNTNLPVVQLAAFERNAKPLTALLLEGIDLRTDSPAWFAHTEQLITLDLSNTQLPAAQLAVFVRNAFHLTVLWLDGIKLDKLLPPWFAQLTKLTELSLNNTDLPSASLNVFKYSASNLTTLMLDGIKLDKEPTTWFVQNTKLVYLSLSNTNLPADGLMQFQDSASALVMLWVDSNPNITEASFACFGEHKERLMALAEKSGWSRTGPNLPIPSPADASPASSGSPSA